MSSYNFMNDTEKLDNLKKFINQKAVIIEENINEIYKMLQDISDSGAWSGTVYENFYSTCNKSKSSLEMMVRFLNAYSELIDRVSLNATKLNSEVTDICNIGG